MDGKGPVGAESDATVVSPRKRAEASSASGPDGTGAEVAATTPGAPLSFAANEASLGASGETARNSTVGRSRSAATATGSIARSESALRTQADAAIASAMLEEEGARAHSFSAIICVATTLVGSSLPFLGGNPIAKWLCFGSLVVMFAASLFVWLRTRDPKLYTLWVHRAYGLVLGTGVGFVEYYLGLFSPVPVILTLGVLFLAQSGDRLFAYLVPIWIVVRWSFVASLIAAGVLVDRGLFRPDSVDLPTHIFAILAVAMVLLMALGMARVSRSTLHEAIRRSQEALMMAHERAVQLEEAKQNLDRALRAVVGKDGRYTGARAGNYVLDVIIGVGAMGEVYAAAGEGTGHSVAVKLLQPDAIERDELVERFLREGEICRRLSSPHVVRVLEVGRMEDGAPFLAMERLHGEDLAARLRRDGHLSLKDATTLARELGKGLVAAHDAGVVHRDLKPQNLFHAKGEDGIDRWKILDFGVSKLGGTSGTLTEHQVVGTPGYMSPEQARGLPVDRRSDVFSMAVVLYRAVTGHPPFSGPSVPETLFDIVYRGPKAPSKLRPEIPTEVELVLAIGLEKEPDRRFQNAAELTKAFAAACRRDLSSSLRERGNDAVKRMPWAAA